MKSKLHKAFFLGALTLMGGQITFAQNYLGVPFGGTATPIGTAVGVADKLELENFDSVAGNVDGANYGSGPVDGVSGTYWDKSAGNSGGAARAGSDVDIAAEGSGLVVTGNQGGEFAFYTVNVLTTGTYHLNVFFKSFAAGKRYQVYLHQINSPVNSSGVLFNASSATAADGVLASTNDPNDGGFIYRLSHNSQPFNLTAGTWLIKARTLDGGPSFDYLTFTLNPTLGVNDAELKANNLKAYPNPSNDGRFNLSNSHKWEVYSILGAKIIEGKGKSVNISSFSKGLYILKTDKGITKSLIYK